MLGTRSAGPGNPLTETTAGGPLHRPLQQLGDVHFRPARGWKARKGGGQQARTSRDLGRCRTPDAPVATHPLHEGAPPGGSVSACVRGGGGAVPGPCSSGLGLSHQVRRGEALGGAFFPPPPSPKLWGWGITGLERAFRSRAPQGAHRASAPPTGPAVGTGERIRGGAYALHACAYRVGAMGGMEASTYGSSDSGTLWRHVACGAP